MGLSHRSNHLQPGSNSGEWDPGRKIPQEGPKPDDLLSPFRGKLRLPEGFDIGHIPLEASKSYPMKIWEGLDLVPRVAYADLNTHKEAIDLKVLLVPKGGKTAPHPQICFFINGPYHVENLAYNNSDPFTWKSWIEFVLDLKHLDQLIETLIKAKLKMQGINA